MSAPRRAFKRVGWYEPHAILRLLAKHRADADNIDAAQVLKRILGDRCILEVAGKDLATNVNHFTLAQSGAAHHFSKQQKIGDARWHSTEQWRLLYSAVSRSR